MSNSEISNPVLKQSKLWRSTSLVASMTLMSRILGFVRDIIIASLFGATAGSDAFFVAFKIPNFFRRLFAEGAFSQAFVPTLADYQQQQSHAQTREFVQRICGTLGLILMLFTLLALLAAPWVIRLFAPGFDPAGERFQIATGMLYFTFPYLLFISITALAGSVLNTYGRYGIPAFTPIVLNLTLIAAALWLRPYAQPTAQALAWGALIAGILQLSLQIPFIRRLNLSLWPKPNWRDPGVKRVLKQMIPALFGSSVAQINLLVDTIFASFLTLGSVSWLYYSERLTAFPLGVFGVAIATVILPHLSRNNSANSPQEFSATLDWALKNVLLIGLPASLGLAMLAKPIMITLFYHGAFTAFDADMASRSLIAFSLGIMAFMLIKILATGFYARKNIATPVRIAAVAMVLNIALNALLIQTLAHAGLALATSISAWFNAACLGILLYRHGIYQPQSGWFKFLLQIGLANIAMLAWLYWLMPTADAWINWTLLSRAGHLLGLIGSAIALNIGLLTLFGLKWRELLR